MQKSKIKEEQCYQKRREEKGQGSHFFKIIHSSCIQDRRLTIPKKFIRIFGKELANVVVLKVPSNKHWEVELVEDEGQVWFQNGWHRFMEYHSISVGHFLVFRYDGNSQFSVVILDTRASEIEYPCDIDCEPTMLTKNSNHVQEHDPCVHYIEGPRELMCKSEAENIKQEECEVSGSIFKVFPEAIAFDLDCPNNYTLSSPPGMLRPRSDDLHQVTNDKGVQSNIRNNTSMSKTLEVGLHCNKQETRTREASILEVQEDAQVYECRRPVSFQEKEQPFVAARAFTSENPICIVIMHSSYNLPVDFARTYLKENVQCVTLRVSDGKRWQVQCSSVTYRFRLMKGWKEFVFDNDLEQDDICRFELVDWKRTEMKVTIFRVLEYPKQRGISAQSKSSGCNPIFLTRNKGKHNEDGNIGNTSELKQKN
ncbi:hypothetical protein AQUCO_02200155v1 [Aquilegia coerulea]|uniref:TF-B3 domain-containing protein n=1 Tax=Aquilegia coerulea TaxID=218851 RepID=A0A2G5DDC2_AQUCA|nr:hypothetical protein AQUCO_02200155v1 [Aquilegia coerulea]